MLKLYDPKTYSTSLGPYVNFSGVASTWEFPKIRGTLSWGPHNKDLTI